MSRKFDPLSAVLRHAAAHRRKLEQATSPKPLSTTLKQRTSSPADNSSAAATNRKRKRTSSSRNDTYVSDSEAQLTEIRRRRLENEKRLHPHKFKQEKRKGWMTSSASKPAKKQKQRTSYAKIDPVRARTRDLDEHDDSKREKQEKELRSTQKTRAQQQQHQNMQQQSHRSQQGLSQPIPSKPQLVSPYAYPSSASPPCSKNRSMSLNKQRSDDGQPLRKRNKNMSLLQQQQQKKSQKFTNQTDADSRRGEKQKRMSVYTLKRLQEPAKRPQKSRIVERSRGYHYAESSSDSELEDFIVSDEEDGFINDDEKAREVVRHLFSRRRATLRQSYSDNEQYLSDDDLDGVAETSFLDMLDEEERSARIGEREDRIEQLKEQKRRREKELRLAAARAKKQIRG